MAAKLDHLTRVEIRSREEWRAWLAIHHEQRESIWIVIWKKGRGPHVGYDAIVEEALCFGWIDSLPRKLDADRSMLLLSPRKAGSRWSAKNKERAERLNFEGRMSAAGHAAIDRAQSDGTWAALDGVERLEAPDDLARALTAQPEAKANFAGFPRSSRRGILEWIAAAKRPETRMRRIAETVRLAGENLKANHPKSRNRGPTGET